MERNIRKLSISIITYPSGWGGMEGHTVELARTLDAKGHEVLIYEVGNNGNFYGKIFIFDEEIGVIHLNSSNPLVDSGLFHSFSILRKVKGNICIFPKGEFTQGSWSFDLIARCLFSRYITIEHLLPQAFPPRSSVRHFLGLIPGFGLWWYKALLSVYLRSIWPNRIVCVSDAIKKRLIDCYKFPPAKINTVHNGINTDIFRPNTKYRIVFRKKYGIPQDSMVFGSLGRFNPVKGFEIIPLLFKELISKFVDRDIWFILVGEGPEKDTLMRLGEDLNIKERYKLVEFTDKPWEIYPAFDVFLMPSRNEGLPLSLLESMACGCCPIAMSVGGIPEVINDSSLGWLVHPNDIQGFYKAMKEVVEMDPDLLIMMGKNARESVRLRFEAGKQFATLVNIIEKECGNA